jgi:hypothetical protein
VYWTEEEKRHLAERVGIDYAGLVRIAIGCAPATEARILLRLERYSGIPASEWCRAACGHPITHPALRETEWMSRQALARHHRDAEKITGDIV